MAAIVGALSVGIEGPPAPGAVETGTADESRVIPRVGNEATDAYVQSLLRSDLGKTAERAEFEREASKAAGGFSLREKYSDEISRNSAAIRGADGQVSSSLLRVALKTFYGKTRASSLSVERVERLIGRVAEGKNHPDANRALVVADSGYLLLPPPGFKPLSDPPEFFPGKPGVGSAFELAFEKSFERGEIFLCETELLEKVPGVNYIHAHLVPKEGPAGKSRAILDASRDPSPLNSSEDRERVRRVWGKQSIISLAGLARMMHLGLMKYGKDVSVGIEDISSAYNQISVIEGQRLLQCIGVSRGVSIIHGRGFFGSNTVGNAFGCLSRLVTQDIRENGTPGSFFVPLSAERGTHCLSPHVERSGAIVTTVVDDCIMIAHKYEMAPACAGPTVDSQVIGVLEYAQNSFCDTFGPSAVSGEKTQLAIPSEPTGAAFSLANGAAVKNNGSSVVYCGWILDVKEDGGGFGVKESNIARAVRTLVAILGVQRAPVRLLLRAAAQISRLRDVITPLRLVCRSVAAQIVLRPPNVWRSYDALLEIKPETHVSVKLALSFISQFAASETRTPFRALACLPAEYLIVTDASGAGLSYQVLKRLGPVDEIAACERYHDLSSDNMSDALAEARTDTEMQRAVESCHEADQFFDHVFIDENFELVAAGAIRMPYSADKLLAEQPDRKMDKRFKSSLQNTWEWIAHCLALAALAHLGVSNACVSAVFDSKTAQKWSKGVTTGRWARIPMLVHAAATLDRGLTVSKTLCIGTNDNARLDLLSREDPVKALTELGVPENVWLFPTKHLVDLLDPSTPWPERDESQFHALWERARNALRPDSPPLFSRFP